MPAIAPADRYTLSRHCLKQAQAKGFAPADILAAAHDPQVTYESHQHPGQWKFIRNGVVAVVDPAVHLVITVFVNGTVTPLRADQI